MMYKSKTDPVDNDYSQVDVPALVRYSEHDYPKDIF